MKVTKLKKILIFAHFALIITLISCVPSTVPKNSATQNASNTRGNRNSNNSNSNETVTPQSTSKINYKSKKTRGNSANNSFESRENILKDITNESERFIDTTYYMLTMENGFTKSSEEITLAGGNSDSEEFRNNLVANFTETINKFESSGTFDCHTFKAFANQFVFNDSLRQEANFYFAECCISNNNLEEANYILEELAAEKLNRGIAPKIIVRLGQLYCVLGDTKQAEKCFKKLKKEFPRSAYAQIADCSRL